MNLLEQIKTIRAEQHIYNQKKLILQLKKFTPETEGLLFELIEQSAKNAHGSAAAVRMLLELNPDIKIKKLAKNLLPLLNKKPLLQIPMVRQLLQCSNKELSKELLILLMADYWVAQTVVREMQDYNCDDVELIDYAENMLPTIAKKDKPAVNEMKHWIKILRK